ncbi:hypothetical protein C9374_014620 [Naegleria lovaniensis]|uniref:Rho family small GTPase n=1 Tax=Naegleria lovaniensis TaxID=51637 RepID=A0AA88GY70_NAELO|nr:uncharacterized protein C9374_014620 [Naegleria lovaniensis]KAG2389220.1 hypothetical protein C9374_014620 [Naegleria lovaniensis]
MPLEPFTATDKSSEENILTTSKGSSYFRYQQFELLLNDDVYRWILSFLNYSDWMQLQLVNKNFRLCQLTEDDQLWKPVYMKKLEEFREASLGESVGVTNDGENNNFYSKFELLKERNENFKTSLIEFIKELHTKADNNFKQLTSDIENVNVTRLHNFYKLEDISKYTQDQIRNSYIGQWKVLKVVVVGDHSNGKSSLVHRCLYNNFSVQYIPQVYEAFSCTSSFLPEYSIGYWDTPGQAEYDTLRTLYYPETTLFLVTYSVVNHNSLRNVATKWIPEIMKHGHNTPFVLVGTKIDLRRNCNYCKFMLLKEEQKPISTELGERMALNSGCVAHLETSALDGDGFDVLDEWIVKLSSIVRAESELNTSCQRKKKCILQ